MTPKLGLGFGSEFAAGFHLFSASASQALLNAELDQLKQQRAGKVITDNRKQNKIAQKRKKKLLKVRLSNMLVCRSRKWFACALRLRGSYLSQTSSCSSKPERKRSRSDGRRQLKRRVKWKQHLQLQNEKLQAWQWWGLMSLMFSCRRSSFGPSPLLVKQPCPPSATCQRSYTRRLCEPLAWRQSCCNSVTKAKLLTDSGGTNLRHAFGKKKIQRKRVNVTAMSSFSLCQHNILNVEIFMRDSVSDFWNSHILFIAAGECEPYFPLNFFLERRKAKQGRRTFIFTMYWRRCTS